METRRGRMEGFYEFCRKKYLHVIWHFGYFGIIGGIVFIFFQHNKNYITIFDD